MSRLLLIRQKSYLFHYLSMVVIVISLAILGCANDDLTSGTPTTTHSADEIKVPPDSSIGAQVRASIQFRVDNGYQTSIITGVVSKEGSEFFAYGNESFTELSPITQNTVFGIGSVTQIFTTSILADMVMRREVFLEDSIAMYLPADLPVSGDAGNIALLHLATHTSGIPRLPDNLPYGDPHNPYADYSIDHMYKYISTYQSDVEPGSVYKYSNYGTGLLGQLLSNRVAATYEDLLQQRITHQLNMEDTSVALSSSMSSRLATGHTGVVPTDRWDMESLAPTGGLHSTASDLIKFVAANLGIEQTPLFDAMSQSHQMIGETGFKNVAIALGWHLLRSENHTIVWQSGETSGYNAFIGLRPDLKKGVVILSNSNGSVDDLGFHLLDNSNPLRQFETPPTLSLSSLQSHIGKYLVEPGVVLDVQYQNGHLTAQVGSQQRFTLYATSDVEFFSESGDQHITFTEDSNEEVTAIIKRGETQTRAKLLNAEESSLLEKKEVPLDTAILEQYVGTYELSKDLMFDVSVEAGRMMVKITGQPKFEVYPESDISFFYKVIDAQITYTKDGEGNVMALILRQDGKDHIALKVK